MPGAYRRAAFARLVGMSVVVMALAVGCASGTNVDTGDYVAASSGLGGGSTTSGQSGSGGQGGAPGQGGSGGAGGAADPCAMGCAVSG